MQSPDYVLHWSEGQRLALNQGHAFISDITRWFNRAIAAGDLGPFICEVSQAEFLGAKKFAITISSKAESGE